MPTLLPLIRQNMTQPGSGGSQLMAKTQGEVKWAADIAIPPLRCEIRELEASAVSVADAYCADFQINRIATQRWDRDERCPFHIALRRRR